MDTQKSSCLGNVAVDFVQNTIDVFPLNSRQRRHIVCGPLPRRRLRQQGCTDLLNTGRFRKIICSTEAQGFQSRCDTAKTGEHYRSYLCSGFRQGAYYSQTRTSGQTQIDDGKGKFFPGNIGESSWNIRRFRHLQAVPFERSSKPLTKDSIILNQQDLFASKQTVHWKVQPLDSTANGILTFLLVQQDYFPRRQ